MDGRATLLCALLLLVHGSDAAIVVKSDSPTNYLLGKTITLTISYDPPKDPTVSWLKNGVSVATWSKGTTSSLDPRLKIIDPGSLQISNSAKTDSGNYSVTVRALRETPGSLNFSVTIYDPVTNPSVSQSPSAVDENTPAVSLNCKADTGGMNYTWTKDGEPLTNDSSYEEADGGQTLKITLPKKIHSGSYKCNVSNPVDSKSATLELKVSSTEAEAVIVRSDSSPNFLLGDNITLSITFTSSNNPSVRWVKNGATLARWDEQSSKVSDENRQEIFGNGSLRISNSTKDDKGNYTVEVDAFGKASGSMIFPVTIYDPVINVSVSQSPAEVDENTTAVNLTCSAATGAVTYAWTKDGKPLTSDGSHVLLDGGQILQIILPKRTDGGNYSCNVSNPVDWKTKSWILSVSGTDGPITVRSDSATNYLVGSTINLTISYTSPNDANIFWYRDGKQIAKWNNYSFEVDDPNKQKIIGNGSLLISNSAKSDSANYSVSVISLGELPATHEFQVTVYDPVTNPSVSQSPDKVNEETPAAKLTCSAATGAMTYAWTRDGQTLPSESSYVTLDGGKILQIVLPKKTHNGNYSCNVSNPVDWKTATWKLSVSGMSHLAATVGVVIGAMLGAILFTEEFWR